MKKRWRSPSLVLAYAVPLVALAFGCRTRHQYDHAEIRSDRTTPGAQVHDAPDMVTLFKDTDLHTRWTSVDWTAIEIPRPSPFFDAQPHTMRFKPRQRPRAY